MTTEVNTKAGEAEWWEFVPIIPKKEPTLATIDFKGSKGPKAAKCFAEVLLQLCDATAPDDSRPALQCVQMQTAKGLRLVTADGYRLAVAEYIPGLRTAKNKASNILARPALFLSVNVGAIATVLKRVSPKGWARLEVKRHGEKRTLSAVNDKGEAAIADEQAWKFPGWPKLVPTEKAAAPATLSAKYLQWAGRFCQAIDGDGYGKVRITHLHPEKPARFDAFSADYRGLAVIMPMWEGIGFSTRAGAGAEGEPE